MKKSRRLSLSILPLISLIAACAALPGGTVTSATTVVYTSGATQHTAAVELQVAADEVFAAMVRIIGQSPDIELVQRNDKALMMEVSQATERRVTGQVTKLGSGASLLYIWADAGSSGQSGRELAISAVEIICDELGVDYELVSY